MKNVKFNGDMYLIKEFNNKILVCVIDGLGHGEHAAVASSRCVYSIEERYKDGLTTIFEYCNSRLRKTNGVVMGIVSIDFSDSSITYAGVGNISARIIGKNPVHLISKNGIVGYNLPRIREYTYSYTHGDTILMYSDGISSKVIEYPDMKLMKCDVRETADEILRLYGKDIDDATVLVAR